MCSAALPLCLLSPLFLPWSLLVHHSCAIMSARTRQLWGRLTVPSSQAVGGCEQGAGPCTRVRVFFLFAVFSKCRKSRLVFLLSTGQSKQKRNLDKEEASAKTHMYTGTRRLSTHLLACTHTHARVLTLTHTPEYNGPCEFPHYWFNPSSV